MKLRHIIVLLAAVGALTGCRHTRPNQGFAGYPIMEVTLAPVESVDFGSDPDAREYRTRLSEAVGKPPDFAGHYVVILIGCGTCCENVALVDARDGHVYFAPFAASLGVDYRRDSRLLIESPPHEVESYYANDPLADEGVFQTSYWEWEESLKAFRELGAQEDR